MLFFAETIPTQLFCICMFSFSLLFSARFSSAVLNFLNVLNFQFLKKTNQHGKTKTYVFFKTYHLKLYHFTPYMNSATSRTIQKILLKTYSATSRTCQGLLEKVHSVKPKTCQKIHEKIHCVTSRAVRKYAT